MHGSGGVRRHQISDGVWGGGEPKGKARASVVGGRVSSEERGGGALFEGGGEEEGFFFLKGNSALKRHATRTKKGLPETGCLRGRGRKEGGKRKFLPKLEG